ncbi:general odorant-binding protein 28a [Teleopsis dalmanni]|uniref:general odorant-binding protein 28a n=1 Tax=Teleopsis dalmanni TaxID=139649 RepID=UPI0018CDA1EF|nr:general odorant-binding protein 28a [Teleopsis dalmanni]
MAKIILVAMLCVLSAAYTKGDFDKTGAIKEFMDNAEACKTETGATPADIDDMLNKKPASGKNGKCLRACLMKKYKVMNADGKFDKAVGMEHAVKWTNGDAEKMVVATEIADFCEGLAVSSDHCDAAEEYGKCFKEQAKAHGIEKFEI